MLNITRWMRTIKNPKLKGKQIISKVINREITVLNKIIFSLQKKQFNFVYPIWYSTTKVMQLLSNVALSSVLLPGNGN